MVRGVAIIRSLAANCSIIRIAVAAYSRVVARVGFVVSFVVPSIFTV